MTLPLHKALKELRLKRSWTQRKAAEVMGVEYNTLRGWEGGKRRTKRQDVLVRLLIAKHQPREPKRDSPAQMTFGETARSSRPRGR